ncbi:MAG: universal stress protein [Euryarchaeota archaeon]|nr:universal stress protein [Euryarchaeota archaeon]
MTPRFTQEAPLAAGPRPMALPTYLRVEDVRPARQHPFIPRRIVVAIEPIHASREALAWAAELGRRFQARVFPITVSTPRDRLVMYGDGADSLFLKEEDAARRVLNDTVAVLERAGLKVGFRLAAGSAVPEILRFADEESADLIILGSHGWGMPERALLGSTADGIKNRASASVLIARTMPPAKDVLTPYDGSPLGAGATGFGHRLAHMSKTRSHLLHVVPPSPFAGKASESRTLQEHVRALKLLGWMRPDLRLDLRIGRPADVILRAAREHGANLIVMGSRGLGGVRSLVAGGVSNQVAHRAAASVLLRKARRRRRA